MNNIYNISKSIISKAGRMGRMLSVLFLLALSSNAWATYYLRLSTDNSKWDDGGSSSDGSFEWSDSKYLVTGTDIYVRILTASDGDWTYTQAWCDGVSGGVAGLYQVSTETIGDNNCEKYAKYRLNVSVSSVKFQYYRTNTQNTCNPSRTVEKGTYNFEFATPTYKLCGSFTDWDPEYGLEMTEVGTTGVFTAQVYLPADTQYEKQTAEGFKIAGVSGGSATWFGADATITKDNKAIKVTSTDGGSDNGNRCGITTDYSGYYTFAYTPSAGTNNLTVTYPTAVSSTPTVYWGEEPTTPNSEVAGLTDRKNIIASAYIASQGCSGGNPIAVDKIRVRFWDADNPSVTDVIELSGSYAINTAYSITIPCDNEILLNCVKSTGKIVMEVGAHNSNGWSAYSDQMEVAYQSPSQFIVTNLAPTDPFTACDGQHQFVFRNMVKPLPGAWTVALSDGTSYVPVSKVSDHFTLTDDGIMVWNTTGKEARTGANKYDYQFTFNKTIGDVTFTQATATIQFNYNVDTPKEITSLTVTGSPTTPWTEVTLTASFDAGIYSGVEWNVDKKSGYNLVVTSEFSDESTTSVAKFKGSTVLPSTTYKITVKGLSGTNCTSTTGLTQNVVVNQDATDCSQATQVLIAAAPVVENGPRATLNGYLKYRGNGSDTCVDDYTTYGFCYATEANKNDIISGTPDLSKATVFHRDKTGAALTESNRNWSYTISTGLEAGQTYYYKAYVKNGSGYVFSSDYGVFSTEGKACVYPAGDVIDYYIDENYDENDKCALQFKTIAAALADLKTRTSGSTDWWDGGNSLLKANVVFHVYPGTYDTSDKSANIDLSAINLYKSTTTPTKRLTIIGETDDPTKKPVLNGLYMAESRWITVQNVKIVRETTGTGLTQSSILIGFNDQSNGRPVGEMANCGLEFVKCDIVVQGFTCIHANGVDGFYMTGCNLVATRTGTITENDRNWGASIKFMNSKNIRMLRNNFRGSHANNIFFQNSRETLIMNNVFWNDNHITYDSGTNSPSFIRLVNFQADNSAHNITKVGIYYNTFFLAQSTESGEDSKTVDFVAFSGAKQISEDGEFKSDRYDVANIHFQYNNCYSYSTHNSGNSNGQFHGKDVTSTFIRNNFWSAKDAATDSFEFGSNVLNHSMERGGDMICSTAPYDPDGLVIKGDALDLGSRITNDASGLGATTISDDRLRDNVRPASGTGWTYGAYQRTAGETLDVIYWLGTENTTWDNRNNWYKKVGNEYHLVTCVDNLSDNLKAVIPEQTGETKRYPKVPVWTNPDPENSVRSEGVYTSTNMFAKTIDILYGASIMDVENLKQGNGGGEAYHYYEGLNHLEAGRKEWLMVGTVICPFNDSIKAMGNNHSAADTVSRFMISKDFYRDHQPHVYMQHFGYIGDASSGSINWSAPFTQLDESVPYDECFTIFCADQYGENKRTAKLVYGDDRGSQPIYYRFRGRFAAAQKGNGAKPSYSFKAGKQYFVNNYYPANVKAWAFNKSGTSVKYYDIISGSWNDIDEDTEVKPQGGIFVNASSDTDITLTELDFTTGSTKYKSAEANQYLILKAYATATGKGSNIAVRQDYKNILKAENASDDNVCELYIPHGSLKLSTISYLDADTVIALGIHNKLSTNMSVKFELVRSSLLDEIYLEDRGVEPVVRYNLLEGEMPYFAGLESGYTEGRFYLVLGSGHTTEPDIPTPAPVVELEKSGIDIFVNENVLTVSASADMTISQITLVDMAGKSYNIPVSNANYCQRKLNAVAGVYTVKVVADKGTETKKIIVK